MVQVDVFWTYALGASFAAAAGRQLKEAGREGASPFTSPYFLRALLFLSILFVPSGVCLLWAFPGWETMFAGDRNLPAWLVTLFCMTNITQGILGFWVAYKLIEKGRFYLAHLQWVFGYLAMFFILVHGWDGTGWHRFLYSGTAEQWRAGVHVPAYAFAYSKVAGTLYLFGILLLPIMFYWLSSWTMDGYRLANLDQKPAMINSSGQITRYFLRAMFIYTLGSAILASILVHLLGWLLGLVVFFGIFYVAGIRQGGLIYRTIYQITLEPEGPAAPMTVTHTAAKEEVAT